MKKHKGYKNRVPTLLTALKAYNAILALGSACKKKPVIKSGKVSGVSLNIFSSDSKFRNYLNLVVYHPAFHWISCFFIIFNSIIISFYTKLRDPNGNTLRIISILDKVTTTFFCFEIISKLIVCGFIFNGKKSLMREPFNVVHLFITILDVTTFFYEFKITWMNTLINSIRMLRLVRLISLNKTFRLRVKAIVLGFPKIAQTLFIAIMFILMFSIVGIQLFKELLYHCSIDKTEDDILIDNIYDCMNYGGEWLNRDVNFDNIISSFLTLFELFTGKSWFPDMFNLQ